jgi:23S rRNA (pseudouridine1915-N3)-methyltransferase
LLSLRFLWVGKTDDREYARGIDRYRARLEGWAKIEERVIRAERERGDAAAQREGRRILASLTDRDRVIALDEKGTMRSTADLAQLLGRHRDRDPRRITFIVGGASGLCPEVLARADEVLSLSPMTFPHQVARLLLIEQVYRALSVWAGLRYHRAP